MFFNQHVEGFLTNQLLYGYLFHVQVRYLGEREVFSPEQVYAALLTKLKTAAEATLKTKVVDCVISVSFKSPQNMVSTDSSRDGQYKCTRHCVLLDVIHGGNLVWTDMLLVI